jgi:hypothetical protein
MKRLNALFFILAICGLFTVIAACAKINTIPGMPATHQEALSAGQVSCTECHEDQQKGTMKAFSTFNHTRTFVKNHRYYASSDGQLCASCHKVSFCTDCHTNQTEIKPSIKYGNRPDRITPHRGDFRTLHKIEGKLDPASCFRCHGRANNERCVSCHR